MHELAVVSKVVLSGEAPATYIRFDSRPGGGWFILAERDLPGPPDVDDMTLVCLGCAIEELGPEEAWGLDVAKADAENAPARVGLAVWDDGIWRSGKDAFCALVRDGYWGTVE
jgi:hypothetical protein